MFQDVDFNRRERFPDDLLTRLLQHFSTYRMRNVDVEADVLGNAYEYLIAKFADDAGAKGGEFYTPKMVVRLIVECLQPEEGHAIYDPTCGSGGMLLEAYHSLERRGLNPKSLHLYGQEININTWSICQMNLFLHNIDDADIRRGDTIRDPKHLRAEGARSLKTFDRVFANPPFSLKNWGHEIWARGDVFGRDQFGCPPKSYGDLAFVQHMVATLNDNGKLGVVLPHGILFRGGKEEDIRKGLIQSDLIEGIIGLASNLFYGAGIPACVLLINKNKTKERKGKVIIVNGEKLFKEGTAQNFLEESHVNQICSAFREFKEVPKMAKVVTIAEIEKNEFNLNIPRYVHISEEEEQLDVATELAALKEILKKRDEAEAAMFRYLKELGYDS